MADIYVDIVTSGTDIVQSSNKLDVAPMIKLSGILWQRVGKPDTKLTGC